MTDIITMSPDLAARKIIVAAFLYYVLDQPTITDAEYDSLSEYVASNWKKLHPDRQWALESAEACRSSGAHFKFSNAAVHAALDLLDTKFPKTKTTVDCDWVRDLERGHYVTANKVTYERR